MSFPSEFPHEEVSPRLWALISSACDGTITQEECLELRELLKADPKALDCFLDVLNINAELYWLVSAGQHSDLDPGRSNVLDSIVCPAPSRSPVLGFLSDCAQGGMRCLTQYSPWSFVFLFVMLATLTWGTTFLLTQNGNVSVQMQNVACITSTKNCRWASDSTPFRESMLLKTSQQLRLESGLVEITYDNGAVVLLEGPVIFTIDSDKGGYLAQGRLTARAATDESLGFTITTPNARFIDQGTEFGVMVLGKGRSEVGVFSGKVEAQAKTADNQWTLPVPLKQGEAVACTGSNIATIAVNREDFPSKQPPPLPPPAPILDASPQMVASFERWLASSKDIRKRKDLAVYYDFQFDDENPRLLVNRAASGNIFNGDIQSANWVEGRFPGKNALEFGKLNSRVEINVNRQFKSVSLIAWVNIQQLPFEFSSLLVSDKWGANGKLHWQLRQDGKINGRIVGQKLSDKKSTSVPVFFADRFNRWCMLATVFDGETSTVTFYLDGEIIGQPLSTNLPMIQIGWASLGGWNKPYPNILPSERRLFGRMDELMLFNRAIDPADIRRIYEAGKP